VAEITIPDMAALAVFFGSVIIYACSLLISMQRRGRAKRGLLNLFYTRWVTHVASSENSLLAVQTMRNLIMSVTFLSSAILLFLGILIRSPEGLADLINFSSPQTSGTAGYKLLLLFSVLLFSLGMFLLSLRQMVRFSILISIPRFAIDEASSDLNDVDTSDLRTAIFLKATNRFTFGIRGTFYGVATMLWFISPYAFMVATLIVTALLIMYHDIRAPRPKKPPI
jgi:uncharacterized membrane protein